MFRKFILASATFIISSTIAYAQSPYLGVGVGALNTENNFGGIGKLFGGYEGLLGSCHQYYLAGELFADGFFNEQSCHCHGSRHHSTHRFTTGLGASILPGFLLTPCNIVFARIGIKTANWNSRYGARHQWQTGGQLGLGMQTRFACHWSVRGEYVYTGCGTFNCFGNRRSNEVDASVVYNFC